MYSQTFCLIATVLAVDHTDIAAAAAAPPNENDNAAAADAAVSSCLHYMSA